MQIFGITKNHSSFESGPPDTSPLNTRLFTKLESAYWDHGSRIVAPVPNMSGEIEVVTRIDESIRRPVAKEDVGKLALSYGFGLDIGSGQRGRDDGQFWRSKGARGYAPVGRFVSGLEVGNLRDLNVGIQENAATTRGVALDGLRYTEVDAIPMISEYCDLQAGDLIYLGKLSLHRGFEIEPKDIVATCDALPTFHVQSSLLEDGNIQVSIVEPANE